MAETRSAVTVAVVSTFNPQRNLLDNCQALLAQCSGVVVVDDGSSSPDESIFSALSSAGCVVHRLATNSGIAAALNRGVEVARALGPQVEYVLTMDQDSLIERGFVRRLEETAEAARAAGVDVGMVAPARVSGLPGRARKTLRGIVVGDEPVQSGLLIPVTCLDEVGAFREELFIDGVDSDFYLRAKAQGLHCVLAPKAALTHSLGTMAPASIGNWHLRWRDQPVLVRTAAPWRYYFIVRNRVLLSRLYAPSEPYWTLRAILLDIRHLVFVTALAGGRRERLGYAIKGLRDGIRNISGPRP